MYHYDRLRDAYHQVVENDRKRKNALVSQQKVNEIYSGRFGYRTTASGRKVARDEPDDETQLRQADAVRDAVNRKRAAQSREKLKASNKVPTKAGKKLFDEFMKEVYGLQEGAEKNLKHKQLEQVYLSARALDDFNKWLLFVREML